MKNLRVGFIMTAKRTNCLEKGLSLIKHLEFELWYNFYIQITFYKLDRYVTMEYFRKNQK